MERGPTKSILVLGATGTLGTYFVDELREAGYTIWATGKRNIDEDYYRRRGVHYTSVDITKKADFEKLPRKGIDSVVHIAGAMPAQMASYKPDVYLSVNIMGTLNVLDYCLGTNVQSYLFTQSHSDVAYLWNTGDYIRPDAARKAIYTGDHAVYIISKNAAVDLVEHYNQEFGLRTFVFRLPTIYCYRPVFDMYVNGKKTPIAYRLLIQKAICSETIEIWGDPLKSKDIVYVKDFNQMLIKAIESSRTKGIYNVGSGVPTTLDEQIKGIVKVFSPEDHPSRIVYRPEKPSQHSYLYDISNARAELGYEPKFSYLEMLYDMKNEMNKDRFSHLKDSITEL